MTSRSTVPPPAPPSTSPHDDPAAADSAALRGPVIVGVDATAVSMSAVTWAAAEAKALGVPLQVISAYLWGLLDPWMSAPDPLLTSQLHRDTSAALQQTVAALRTQFPDLVVTDEAAEGDPRDLLAERGKHASMIVVGTRHLHAFGRAMLGSVSTELTVRATCPVIVLCGPPSLPGERGSIIAGVTGEAATDDVLAFAFAQAQAHDLPLRAVMCWRPDGSASGHPYLVPPPRSERAKRWLADALACWITRYPDVEVRPSIVHDHAVSGLVSAASGQDLLVVGRHGHRARFGAMLGSVSQGVLHHATCPVAVIPVNQDGGRPGHQG